MSQRLEVVVGSPIQLSFQPTHIMRMYLGMYVCMYQLEVIAYCKLNPVYSRSPFCSFTVTGFLFFFLLRFCFRCICPPLP
ncbi:hypothetical protein F4810DRAFT_654337 [Camillea tinctor]|nr:hypothetical protein F4810DRAFT_654337 [Camillea tinctor]